MKGLTLVVAGSLVLAPLVYAQDHAVSRGGGGGGSSPSGGGGGHPTASSGGSSGGSSYSGGSSSSGTSSSGGSYAPSSKAEARHPRAGTGSGYGYGGGYYPSYPGYPGYYPGYWYGSYWWPYGAYGWYGGYWGGGYWGGGTVYHRVERETGSLRVLVDPPEARVYVDGYYAGVVDDYDGLFQRLNVAPGRHEITLKLEGYKSHRMRVYVAGDSTLKLRYDLQKGTGESFEDLAAGVPEGEPRRERETEERWEMQEKRDRADDAMLTGSGTLKLTVRPADASVYVDGAFRGTGREASSLQLQAGRHRVEVVRPGYRTVDKEVEVQPGQATELAVDLDKGAI